jgi:hypothetical protein
VSERQDLQQNRGDKVKGLKEESGNNHTQVVDYRNPEMANPSNSTGASIPQLPKEGPRVESQLSRNK